MKKKNEKKWCITVSDENNVSENELIFCLQNAMLLSLVEKKTITRKQYEATIERLKTKK